VEDFGGQMAQLQEEVVLVGTNTTALANLESHRPGDDVSTSQVLGGRGITLHETLTL
jgi:hypothetical protein